MRRVEASGRLDAQTDKGTRSKAKLQTDGTERVFSPHLQPERQDTDTQAMLAASLKAM